VIQTDTGQCSLLGFNHRVIMAPGQT